jgi:hypothetical protein
MKSSVSLRKQEERSTPTQRIRPELNIEKWSIWLPANSRGQGLKERVFEREFQLPDGTKVKGTLTVSPTAKGDLTTEDQRVYYALVRIWEAKGRSDTYTPFSLRHLSKVLGRRWGGQTIRSLRGSLARLAMTSLTWDKTYEDGAARSRLRVNEVFHIVGSLKTVYREKDGHVTTEAGYFRFHDAIIKNLQIHYTKPVLFDVVLSFRSEIAQILYTHLDLILSDKTSYERRSRELFEDLGLVAAEYSKPSARARRLEPALKELQGKPLTTGLIAKATLKRTNDGEDYKLTLSKAPLASPVPRETEVILFASRKPASPEAEELVRYFHLVFHDAKECTPTWKSLEQATPLLARVGREKARHLIDFAYKEAQATKYKVSVFGGILQYESRALLDFEKSKESRARRLEIQEAMKIQKMKDAGRRLIDARVSAYLEPLSAEATSDLDTHALAEISDSERARYHEAQPSFRGLLMKLHFPRNRVVRQASR